MKIKLLIIFIFTIAICACTSESNRHEKFGRFIVTTRLLVDKLKWEGGNSHLDYTEVCRDDGQFCFRGDDDLGYLYSRRFKRLAVYSKLQMRIFNTENGEEIICDLSKLKARLIFAVDGYWSESSLILFSRSEADDGKITQSDVFSFSSGRCESIRSVENYFRKKNSERTQDLENSGLAWFECGKTNCTLKWLESDFITSHQKEIGCNENNNLEIVWINGVPEPWNRNGPKKLHCLNEAGELKYPFPPDVPFVADNTADATY